jgi:hypothetical protein
MLITEFAFFLMLAQMSFLALLTVLLAVLSSATASPDLSRWISPDHKVIAQKILKAALSPPLAGLSWNRLAEMSDTFGPRISGSQALESSIGM